MNKQETIQTISNKEPLGKDLAITLFCIDCNTLRTFKITDNLNLVLNRELEGLKISSFCEKCKKEMAFSLFWTNLSTGFSYRTKQIEGLKVIDNSGLIEVIE